VLCQHENLGTERRMAELKVTTAQGGLLEETLKPESRSAVISHMLRTLWTGAAKIISEPSAIDIVGHRVVHGGQEYKQSTFVTDGVKAAIGRLCERGISGLSSDLREVLAAIRRGDSRAQLAFDVYVHSLRTQIGAMLTSLSGEKDPKMLEGFTPDHVGAVAKQVLNRCQGKGRLNG